MNNFWTNFRDVILDAKWALVFSFAFLIIGLYLKDENTPILLGTFGVMFFTIMTYALVDSYKKSRK